MGGETRIVGWAGEGVVDDAEGFVPEVAGAVVGGVVDEGDELEVGAVAEDDELVFGFGVAMAAAGGEGEVRGYPGGWGEERGVGDEDDDVVELGGHLGWRF